MDEQQINEISDRVVEALNGLAPREPEWWEIVAGFGSYAVLAAAIVALIIGSRTLRQQGRDLRSRETGAREALVQRQEADERAEWWRRAETAATPGWWNLDPTPASGPPAGSSDR